MALNKGLAVAAMLYGSAAFSQMRVPVPTRAQAPMRPGLTLNSQAFIDGGVIPDRYSKAGGAGDHSPELGWAYVPDGVGSFVLMVHDPDVAVVRTARTKMHWLIFNLPGTSRELAEGVGAKARLTDGSVQALNDDGSVGYLGLGAPAVGPYHHYLFELYALDVKLPLGPDALEADVVRAMQGHVMAKGVLVGRFHLP